MANSEFTDQLQQSADKPDAPADQGFWSNLADDAWTQSSSKNDSGKTEALQAASDLGRVGLQSAAQKAKEANFFKEGIESIFGPIQMGDGAKPKGGGEQPSIRPAPADTAPETLAPKGMLNSAEAPRTAPPESKTTAPATEAQQKPQATKPAKIK